MITADTAAWRLRQERNQNYMSLSTVRKAWLDLWRRWWRWSHNIVARVYGLPPFCLAGGGWETPRKWWGACEELFSDVGIKVARNGMDVYDAYRLHLSRYQDYVVARQRDASTPGIFIVIAPDRLGDHKTTLKNAEKFAVLTPKSWKKIAVWQKPWPWLASEFRIFYSIITKLGYDGVALPTRYMPAVNGVLKCARESLICLKAVYRALEVVGDSGWLHLLGAPKRLIVHV